MVTVISRGVGWTKFASVNIAAKTRPARIARVAKKRSRVGTSVEPRADGRGRRGSGQAEALLRVAAGAGFPSREQGADKAHNDTAMRFAGRLNRAKSLPQDDSPSRATRPGPSGRRGRHTDAV